MHVCTLFRCLSLCLIISISFCLHHSHIYSIRISLFRQVIYLSCVSLLQCQQHSYFGHLIQLKWFWWMFITNYWRNLLHIGSFSQKSGGVNNKINDGWIPFSCFSFRVLLLCMLATVTLSWPTGTLEYSRAIVNVISNTCALPLSNSPHELFPSLALLFYLNIQT